MATSVNYIQGNSLRIILPLMVIQLHEDGTTTEGSFVPLDGDVFVVTLKGKRVYHYTPTIEEIDGEHCAVFVLSGVELCGTYSLELVVSRADGTRLRYANPDALTLEHFTGEVSGGTGGAPLIVGGVVLDPSLFIFAKGDKGDDGEDGVGITSITKTGTSGLVDTYTITYTNDSTSTFNVTNGRNGTDGTDGTDGVGVVSIVQTTTSTESGGINVITCTLTNGDVSTFEIRNGKDGGGASIVIDHSPTQGSENAVSSGGVYDALQGKQNTLTFDNVPTEDSLNPVISGGIFDALKTKQDTLTFDNTPTEDSSNPVKSGGVYDALQGKQNTLTFDDTPTANSNNPVKSSGIYNMCPIIEDTRSSLAAAITGVAPFASLVDGQRIVLHLKYATTNNTTLSLTLSGGGATAAKPIKASYRFAGNGSVGLDINIRSNSYVGLVWDATNDWWHTLSDIDTDTINSPVSLTDVTNESTLSRAITGKFIHDNISLKRTVVTTGSALTADTYLELGTTDTVAPTLPATYTDADEFIFSFTCDTSACSVTLPTGVELADNCDNFSEVAAGVFFQVSIMNDVAAYLCVTPTTP